jgi:outer membrane protein
MKDTIEKQAPMLTPEARTSKEKEFQLKGREFQRWVEDYQNELNQKRMEVERTISMGLQKVIQKVGTEEGYTLIVEKNETIVLFAAKSIDLTDKIIKLYDSQRK